MDNQITLKEAMTAQDIARHWREMDAMLLRDVRPNCDLDGPMTDQEAARFLGPAYRERIDSICSREVDPGKRLFFLENGVEVGFALYCTYHSEDGKCFIIDFCVYPPHRCRGLGKRCFAALAERARADGTGYFELNTHCSRARRFWESLGFRYNGCDEEGAALFCLPPQDAVPITVEVLRDPDHPDLGWQLDRLEQGFLREIGEAPLDNGKKERLKEAIRSGKIAFFLAKRGYRAVGMCSVTTCFSTFACSDIGVFDDFFVEPVFRRQGVARKLAVFAQDWCKEKGLASLTVGCWEDDAEMYRSLGFGTHLGTMLACPTDQ